MLKINNLTFRYPNLRWPVIDNLSLELSEGGVYGLLGSNGAGKSTLLSLACGLLTPQSGNVTLDNVDVRLRLPETMNNIIIVPEEMRFPSLRISEYMKLYGAFYQNFSADEMRSHLKLFSLSDDRRLNQLSMGERKKVALSFAMACNTKLIIMDEPTNGLDIPGKSAFRKFIASSMRDDKIFVISTHQVRDVGQILDHVIIMNNSRFLLNASVNDILNKLSFTTTSNPEVVKRALYAVSNMMVSSVVLPSTGNDGSNLDLELLFEFAVSNPESLNNLFPSKS